jgi:acetylornithine aminotransferase
VTAAISDQASRVIHTSNLYRIEAQEKLGAKLCAVAGMESCFFGNSGAEANEAAIKLARLRGHQRQIDKPTIVVMEQAFHGRTLATLSATGNRKIQAGFEPLVTGFTRAPINDLEALAQIARSNGNVVAVLVEPLQGEGGVRMIDPDYLRGVRKLCDEQDWLLMLDEVQTGNGRTGSYFAYQGMGLVPDVVTTAKGLGNGVPIGACLARGSAATVFGPGNHGSTYGGNPLACAAGLAVMETIEQQDLCAHAGAMGELIREQLAEALAGNTLLREIRGKGLMIGIELSCDCGELVPAALEAGLLINVAAGNTIRLLPPLVISREESLALAAGVAKLADQFAAAQSH